MTAPALTCRHPLGDVGGGQAGHGVDVGIVQRRGIHESENGGAP